ncbi:hypothetical protein D3C75_726300 [compost metagenome]
MRIQGHVRQPGCRQQIPQADAGRLPEEIAIGLIDLRGSPLLAVEAVTGNVRRCQHAQFGQRHVDFRLAFPDIEHCLQVFTLQQHIAQCRVVDHRSTTGIDQPGTGSELVEAFFIEQMPGRLRPLLGQRRVQADDVALVDDPLEADVVTAFIRLPGWIAHQHLPAQALQDLDQSAAHLAGADHAVGTPGQVGPFDFGQGQQAAEHIVDHAAGIAARCTGPGDAGLLKVIQVQMIGADGARTDKAHLAALEQRAIDVGHRTHQQHIGLLDRGTVDGATRHPADFTEAFKEGIEQGDIFVGNNQHGRLLWRIGSVGVDDASRLDASLCRSELARDGRKDATFIQASRAIVDAHREQARSYRGLITNP